MVLKFLTQLTLHTSTSFNFMEKLMFGRISPIKLNIQSDCYLLDYKTTREFREKSDKQSRIWMRGHTFYIVQGVYTVNSLWRLISRENQFTPICPFRGWPSDGICANLSKLDPMSDNSVAVRLVLTLVY